MRFQDTLTRGIGHDLPIRFGNPLGRHGRSHGQAVAHPKTQRDSRKELWFPSQKAI